MLNETKRIPILYCRVSSERQKNEGSGLESQEQRCRQYCIQKSYGEPVMVFKDSFTGGGDFMLRPAMGEMIKYIDKNLHKNYVVIFDDLKRFARDTEFHLKLRSALKVRNVKPECLNYNFDDSPEGTFVETIFAAQGQLEREQNKRQVVQKQQARLERGFWSFHAPKGYTMKRTEDGNVCFPNDLGFILKEGLEGFAYKKFLRQIDLAKFLQEKGFFSKRVITERHLETTKNLILNPFYAGYIEYKPWEVKRFKGRHQAIISDDIFCLNQKRLRGESKMSAPRQDMREEFSLRSLVNCSGCNRPMTAYYSTSKTGLKHPYYSCQNKGCALRSKTIKKKDIDSNFKKLISSNRPKEKFISITGQMFEDLWKTEMGETSYKTSDIGNRKNKLEEDIRKLADDSIDTDNPIVKRQYNKRIEEKTKEIEDIDATLNKKIDYSVPYRTSYEKITGMIKDPYKIWEKGTVKQRQDMFYFMFDSNLVYEYNIDYRTPEKSCLYKLFDRIEAGHTVQVEMGGIEPPCK